MSQETIKPVETPSEAPDVSFWEIAKGLIPSPKRKRKIEPIIQESATACGPTCLTMILNYYGCQISVSEVQELSETGRDGLSALAIVRAARNYGLRVKPVSIKEPKTFQYVRLPAIIHWEFNHFMIVEQWTPQWVDVVDPAIGRRRINAEEFDAGFTGVTVALEPGINFQRHRGSPQLSLVEYLRATLQAPGVLVQILMASLLLQILGLGFPILTQIVVDQIIPNKLSNVITLIGLGMLFLIAAQLVTTLLRSSLLVYLQARLDSQMMLGFLEHLLMLPYRFFQQRSAGDLLTRLNSNVVIRDTLSSQLVSIILDGGLVILYLLILLWQAPTFGIVVLGMGVVQLTLVTISGKFIHRLMREELVAIGKSQGYINETLLGVATLKTAGAEYRAFDHWSNLFFKQLNISVRRNYLSSVVEALTSFLRILAPLLLLWVGAQQVLAGSITLGTMLALNALAISCLIPLSTLAGSVQHLQTARAHFERVAEVIKVAPEQEADQVKRPPNLTGAVELKNVSFRYDANSPLILDDISLQIKAGQKVAVVGRTGSGKSTLGKLLLGLYLPTEGEIYYDGVSLEGLDYRAVRRQFGVVLQDAFVFNSSIRENIAFNNPELSLEGVSEAARLAAIHDDIERMPMGYETIVSEAGNALSGGQRQRLTIARALAHQPCIMLFDEATSSLDVLTEQEVESNLNKLNCTRIVIAHRLSTVRSADLILVMDQGHIIEQGSHSQLLGTGGFYSKLVKGQIEMDQEDVAQAA